MRGTFERDGSSGDIGGARGGLECPFSSFVRRVSHRAASRAASRDRFTPSHLAAAVPRSARHHKRHHHNHLHHSAAPPLGVPHLAFCTTPCTVRERARRIVPCLVARARRSLARTRNEHGPRCDDVAAPRTRRQKHGGAAGLRNCASGYPARSFRSPAAPQPRRCAEIYRSPTGLRLPRRTAPASDTASTGRCRAPRRRATCCRPRSAGPSRRRRARWPRASARPACAR